MIKSPKFESCVTLGLNFYIIWWDWKSWSFKLWLFNPHWKEKENHLFKKDFRFYSHYTQCWLFVLLPPLKCENFQKYLSISTSSTKVEKMFRYFKRIFTGIFIKTCSVILSKNNKRLDFRISQWFPNELNLNSWKSCITSDCIDVTEKSLFLVPMHRTFETWFSVSLLLECINLF